MKLKKLLSTLQFKTSKNYDENFDVSDICHNSRSACSSSLFVCIKGATVDGHDFAFSAYQSGCRHFIAEHEIRLPSDANVFYVEDTKVALAYLSACFFDNPADSLKIIGITGTKGKTTTALMLYHIFNACGYPCGYIGSNGVDFENCHYNTSNTTPDSLELHRYMRMMLNAGIKYLAVEVSSQALYMKRVCGIKFDTCIFTNLSADHIGKNEHPDFEHYKLCKKSLFTDYGTNAVIYNADDKYANEITDNATAEKISYAIHGSADYQAWNLKNFRNSDHLGTSFKFTVHKKQFSTKISFPGVFSVYNALAAIATCRHYGIPMEKIDGVISDIQIAGRFETVFALPYATFIIDYAHNGASLSAALKTLRTYSPNKLICVFGSVGGRTFGRRAELGKVAAALADFSILTSDNPDFEDPNDIIKEIEIQFEDKNSYVKIPDRKKAVEFAVSVARPGDIVLLAGKGHENYQLINGKKLYFSEKGILLEACKDVLKQNI